MVGRLVEKSTVPKTTGEAAKKYDVGYSLRTVRETIKDEPFHILDTTHQTFVDSMFRHTKAVTKLTPAQLAANPGLQNFYTTFRKELEAAGLDIQKASDEDIRNACLKFIDKGNTVLALRLVQAHTDLIRTAAEIDIKKEGRGTKHLEPTNPRHQAADGEVTLKIHEAAVALGVPDEYVKAYFEDATIAEGTELKERTKNLVDASCDFYRQTMRKKDENLVVDLTLNPGKENRRIMKDELRGANQKDRMEIAIKIISVQTIKETGEAREKAKTETAAVRYVHAKKTELEKKRTEPIKVDEQLQADEDKRKANEDLTKLTKRRTDLLGKPTSDAKKAQETTKKDEANDKLDALPKIKYKDGIGHDQEKTILELHGKDGSPGELQKLKEEEASLREETGEVQQELDERNRPIQEKRSRITETIKGYQAVLGSDGFDPANAPVIIAEIRTLTSSLDTDVSLKLEELTVVQKDDVKKMGRITKAISKIEGALKEAATAELVTTYDSGVTKLATLIKGDGELDLTGNPATIDAEIKAKEDEIAALVDPKKAVNDEIALYNFYETEILDPEKRKAIMSRLQDRDSTWYPEGMPGAEAVYYRALQFLEGKDIVEPEGGEQLKKFSEFFTEADFYEAAQDELKRIALELHAQGVMMTAGDVLNQVGLYLDNKAMLAVLDKLETRVTSGHIKDHSAQTAAVWKAAIIADYRTANIIP